MKSSVEALEGNKVKVVVELEEEEFEKDLDAAFRRLAKEVRLPGFRPGKAPRKVLEARIGQGYARDEAFREALPGYYTEAVKEHEVDVIAPPEIDITHGRDEGPVTFDAVVEVRPSVTVEGYEALEIKVTVPTVTDEDVDDSVNRFLGRFGELTTVDRPVEKGDTVVIDISTYYEDELLGDMTATDYEFLTLHMQCDDEHGDHMRQISLELAEDLNHREALRFGVMSSLNLRNAFWDMMLARAVAT